MWSIEKSQSFWETAEITSAGVVEITSAEITSAGAEKTHREGASF